MVHPLIGRDTIEPQNSRHADNIETLRQWTEMVRGIERNMAAELNNKFARRNTCQLLPVLTSRRGEGGVFLYQAPEYFPATVAEFLNMSVERVIYLLNFYDLQIWEFVGDPSDEKLRQLEFTPAEISSNYIRYLKEISRAIRVEFPKLQSRRLEEIRALQANQTQGP
ncbi:hypothetical protein TWF225_004989 [Orbilia oligospora]|uniref:Uncharacterized protein n=1 Tax=Orbilia oligospora TaxID=2813651 RepID=A0A7C8P7B7_ORBOL|nr:hypothetical protein TWF751_011089 [Orbilia oligospora]KAF3186020.1 hypothetical protein TWF225_004989 [Orbilia oligospora]KAF3241882.1 hypothetical protein TWF217_011919 [Orbilia oligospora]KAF3262644.1 hypothetical protein TWF128_002402 [Orbilia oligospora]KAF3295869.1 hypothetical protein TWF132_000419 [Orbilia oligospora]